MSFLKYVFSQIHPKLLLVREALFDSIRMPDPKRSIEAMDY